MILTSQSDEEFLSDFQAGAVREFRHRDHIRLAWLYVGKHGVEEGSNQIIGGIKKFAAHHGATQLYHETITRFWILTVYQAIEGMPPSTFPEFLEANPHLEDKNYIYTFYSKERLMSEEAKRNWIPPVGGAALVAAR
jgi:hypothetical protein